MIYLFLSNNFYIYLFIDLFKGINLLIMVDLYGIFWVCICINIWLFMWLGSNNIIMNGDVVCGSLIVYESKFRFFIECVKWFKMLLIFI